MPPGQITECFSSLGFVEPFPEIGCQWARERDPLIGHRVNKRQFGCVQERPFQTKVWTTLTVDGIADEGMVDR